MNRLQQLVDLPNAAFETSFNNQPDHQNTANHQTTAHSVFVPLHYEPNYAYPLLIWLHGPDDNENQLKKIMPLLSMKNYVGVAPRGTWAPQRDDAASGRFAWSQDDEQVLLAQQRTLDCIELAQQRFHIASDHIFLAGYDCGGTMAVRLAMRHPKRFAGAISVGGPFPTGYCPLLYLEQIRHMQILIAHGRDSQDYPMDRICDDLRLFHAAGLKVTLRQYPCGDELTTKMLEDIDGWVMQQVTGVPASKSSSVSRYQPQDLN